MEYWKLETFMTHPAIPRLYGSMHLLQGDMYYSIFVLFDNYCLIMD